LFGQGEHKEGVYDLTGSYGRECYLAAVPTARITKGALAGEIYAIGLMACGTTGYLHHVLVTVNGATTNFIMYVMKRTGSTSVKPCNRIESEFSDVWYAMLTFVHYVTMIFTMQTCPHTPE